MYQWILGTLIYISSFFRAFIFIVRKDDSDGADNWAIWSLLVHQTGRQTGPRNGTKGSAQEDWRGSNYFYPYHHLLIFWR